MKTNIFFLLLSGLFLLAGCAKEYSVETGGKERALGNWEFKDSAAEYMGSIDTAYIVTAGSTNQLTFAGKSLDGKQKLVINIFGEDFKTGSYRASVNEVSMNYTQDGKSIYKVNQLTEEFTLNITSVSGDLFTGTFKGKAQDSTGARKDLYDGKFKFLFPNASEPVSSGIMGSISGVCQDVSLVGNYQKGVAMTSQNTAVVEVTVTKAGTYNIYTEAVDGISFSGSGVFTQTGTQKVTLTAKGTATTNGDKKFVVRFGNSQCAFTVPFTENTNPYDYFPLTTNSQWKYGSSADSIMFEVTDLKQTIGSDPFTKITTHGFYPIGTQKDTILVRKKSGNYYSFYDNLLSGELNDVKYNSVIILKDNVPAGTSWNANAITANLNGTTVKVDVTFTITEKSVRVEMGRFDFLDVIKVKEDITSNGAPLTTREVWYARNVGIIHQKIGNTSYNIGDYKIF